MRRLFFIKEVIKNFYDRHGKYVNFFLKFAILLLTSAFVTGEAGFVSFLCNPVFLVGISFAAAFLPLHITALVPAALSLIHVYALSRAGGIVVTCFYIVSYLLFFRFAPKAIYLFLITVICFWLKVPYLIPVLVALFMPLVNVIGMNLAIIVFYMFRSISTFTEFATRDILNDNVLTSKMMWQQFLSDHSVYIFMVIFTIVYLVVCLLKNLPFNYSWESAIFIGAGLEIGLFIASDLVFGYDMNITFLAVESAAAVVLGLIYKNFSFTPDYNKTVYLTLDDEDYYYYIKAVPKIKNINKDIEIRHINANDFKEPSAGKKNNGQDENSENGRE